MGRKLRGLINKSNSKIKIENIHYDNSKYIEYKKKLFENLNTLRTEDGLFRASNNNNENNGYYKYSWWRDNYFANVCYLNNDNEKYIQSCHTFIDVLWHIENKYNNKISNMIKNPDRSEAWKRIHARVLADVEHDEVMAEWGNKQNDAVTGILLSIFDGIENGLDIIRNEKDHEMIQMLVDYIIAIEYWHDSDNGHWEEREAINSSSIAMCYMALYRANKLGYKVDRKYIELGREVLDSRLPNESHDRRDDLALLSGVYVGATTLNQTKLIVENIENNLLRTGGVIRYKGDVYYNTNPTEPIGTEGEWCFGKIYLGIIYNRLGYKDMAKHYLDSVMELFPEGNIGEMILSNGKVNDNSLLAWANSLCIKLIDEIIV